jgi:hypothetical protein
MQSHQPFEYDCAVEIPDSLDRVKESPLSKLDPPLPSLVKPLVPTLKPTSSSCPLSSQSFIYVKKELARVIRHLMLYDLTEIDRVCGVMIDELQNLRSVGSEYLIEMEDGD